MTSSRSVLPLLLTAAMATPAAAQPDMSDAFTGPYVGVQAAYTTGDVEAGLIDFDAEGGNYGIYAGMKADALFDNTINRLGTSVTGAIEVHYNWADADDRSGAVSLDKQYDWGVSLRPGLGVLDEALPIDWNPYGILGYRRAEYELTSVAGTSDETFDGFELGLGTELLAYDQLGTRLEYSYTWYGEEGNIDPSEHNIRLGVAYHF